MSLVKLIIERIQYSETQSGAYVLFLKDEFSNKKLPIVIGGIEAHSIAIGLEKDIAPQRPLTHDLFKSVMKAYHINLKKVIINKYDQGVFYAMLVTEKDGIETSTDSRTSDAVAMAVRYQAPIFCESDILEETGIDFPDNKAKKTVDKEEDLDFEGFLKEIDKIIDENEDEKSSDNLSDLEKLSLDLFGMKKPMYSKQEINKMLNDAIADELYEKAAKYKHLLDLM